MPPETDNFEANLLEKAAALPASDPLRVSRRRRWRNDILCFEMKDIAVAFERDGVPRPDLSWTPKLDDCTTPQTRLLLQHWLQLVADTSLPTVQLIDPIKFAPALGFAHLVEPLSCGEEFVYRIFGTSIAGISGGDFSGRSMMEMQASDYVVDFGIASCAAVCESKKPLLTRRCPAKATVTAYWERLLLPFVGRSNLVERLLIGIVPVSTSGDVIFPRAAL